jgi:hypothetical protein
MWFIPEWAIGAAFAAFGLFGGIGMMLRLMPPEMRKQGQKGLSQDQRAMLEEMEGRLGEIEDLQRRVVELEGRLDFAERMLTKGKGEG